MIPKQLKHKASAIVAAAAVLLLGVSQADAHAKLVSTVPAANSAVASPKMIEVHFNEAIELKLSSLKLATSEGTDIPIMSMNNAKDATMLAIMPNSPLKAGAYKVSWNVVSDDGHKEKGDFKFTVQ